MTDENGKVKIASGFLELKNFKISKLMSFLLIKHQLVQVISFLIFFTFCKDGEL